MALSLKLFGRFEIRDGSGSELPIRLRKTRALLAYLAVHADTPLPRERLMTLLWSSRDEQQARRSLNDALFSIRRLGNGQNVQLIDSDGEQVTLHSRALESDVARFQALLNDDPYAAAAFYDAPFLDGLSVQDPAFEDWLIAIRSEFEAKACDALFRAADAAARRSDTGRAIEVAKRLAALDPLREDAHRLLMRLLYESGDRVGALRQYQACADLLQRELQVEPGASTKALYEEIKQDDATSQTRSADGAGEPLKDDDTPITNSRPRFQRWFVPVAAGAAVVMLGGSAIVWFAPWAPLAERAPKYCASLSDKPSIAVLPFKNLSGNPETNYLSAGFTEDIITRLARRADMFVAARTSSVAYRDRPVTVEQIGRELGVGYVLEGSVQRAGNRIRITAQLIDTDTGSHIWAEQYDRANKDLFAIQDEITKKVGVELAVKLTKGEMARINFKSTKNIAAYDYYLRGWEAFDNGNRWDNQRAKQLFEKAIQLDPQYARAIANLGFAHMRRRAHLNWGYDPGESLKQAEELAKQALAIDANSAHARMLLAFANAYRGQFDKAVAEGKRAVLLEPNHPDRYVGLAWIMLYAGHLDEATQLITRAYCLICQRRSKSTPLAGVKMHHLV